MEIYELQIFEKEAPPFFFQTGPYGENSNSQKRIAKSADLKRVISFNGPLESAILEVP